MPLITGITAAPGTMRSKLAAIPRADITNYNPLLRKVFCRQIRDREAGNMLPKCCFVAGSFALKTLLGAIGGPIGAVAGEILGPVLTQILVGLFGGNSDTQGALQDSSQQVYRIHGDKLCQTT